MQPLANYLDAKLRSKPLKQMLNQHFIIESEAMLRRQGNIKLLMMLSNMPPAQQFRQNSWVFVHATSYELPSASPSRPALHHSITSQGEPPCQHEVFQVVGLPVPTVRLGRWPEIPCLPTTTASSCDWPKSSWQCQISSLPRSATCSSQKGKLFEN